MNWDHIEAKWAEMTLRVRAGAPGQPKGTGLTYRQGEPRSKQETTTKGERRVDADAETTGPVNAE